MSPERQAREAARSRMREAVAAHDAAILAYHAAREARLLAVDAWHAADAAWAAAGRPS